MDNPRSTKVKIGGQEYRMLLSFYATREISRRFGSLQKMADKMANTADFGELAEHLAFLLHLLVEQGEMNHHLLNPDAPARKIPDEESIMMLMAPGDVDDIRGGILGAITKGMRREVESEKENDEGN